MKKELTIKIIGYLALALWTASTLAQIYFKSYYTIFWFCNFSIFLLAIAAFKKSPLLLYFIFAPSLLFQLPWAIDWLLNIFFNISIFGVPELYLGVQKSILILSSLRHTLSIPAIIILFFLIKPQKLTKKQFILMIGATVFILLFSFFLPVESNINCAHKSCGINLNLSGIPHLIAWTIIVLVISLIVLFLITIPLHKKITKYLNIQS